MARNSPQASTGWRTSVGEIANAFIFLAAVLEVLLHAPWWRDGRRSLVAFSQTIVYLSQLDLILKVSHFCLIFAFVVVCIFLGKLYMSLTVFDNVPQYNRRYLNHMQGFLRRTEWLLRLCIFLYLLAGLPTYNTIIQRMRGLSETLPFGVPRGFPGWDQFLDISIYLSGLLAICLLWDLVLLAAAYQHTDRAAICKAMWTNFMKAHAIGFSASLLFVIFFSSEAIAARAGFILPTIALVLLFALARISLSKLAGPSGLWALFKRAIRVRR